MKMEWEIVQQFIKPELLVLVVVLYFIGLALKSAAFFSDKHIPLVLGIIGILLALLYLLAVSELTGRQQVAAYLSAGITQGVLCAGGSVYANQIFKQATKKE